MRFAVALSAAVVAIVFMGFYGAVYHNYAQDDAFITYQYARNLAAGHGYSFNPGEQILGTTTPAYAALLAFVHLITRLPVHQVGLAVFIVCIVAGGALLYILADDYPQWVRFGMAALYVTNPFIAKGFGMESMFLVVCLLSTLWAYREQKTLLTGLLITLCMLTRYEMVFLGGILFGIDVLVYRRIPWWALYPLVLMSAWIAYTIVTFGSFVPQSVVAKMGVPFVPFGLGGLVLWYDLAQRNILFNLNLFLFLIGIYFIVRKRRLSVPLWGLIGWTAIYFAASLAIAGSFPWYYLPLIPVSVLVVSLGIYMITDVLSKSQMNAQLPQWIGVGLIVVLVGTNIFYVVSDWVTAEDGVKLPRESGYAEVAAYLNENADPDAVLGVHEIGVLGYMTDLYIVDFNGLVTPQATAWEMEHGATFAEVVGLFEPTYILLGKEDDANGRFYIEQVTGYEEIETFGTDDLPYYLFQRTETIES